MYRHQAPLVLFFCAIWITATAFVWLDKVEPECSYAMEHSYELPPVSPCATDLILSEYAEGSSNNKYLEIYNGTGAAVNLSGYDLAQYNNGSSSVSFTLSLSGILNDGDTYVIENGNEALGVSADLSTTASLMTFNGNDVIALRKSGSNIDVIGTIGSGLNFAQNTTLRRKASVTSPTTSYSTGEWDIFPQNTISGFGSHTMDCGGGGCTITGASAGTATCSGSDATFSVTFTPTNGSGSYQVVNATTSAVLGSGSASPITATVTGATGGSVDVKVIDVVNTGCESNTVNVSLPDCSGGGGGGCASDLILSEYVEGSSNNKYLEIFNNTGAAVNLSNYDLAQYNNGSSSVSFTLSLSGTLNDGDTYVIENGNEVLGVNADLSTTASLMTFNGNDVIALRKMGTNIDLIGVIGTSTNFAADVTLRRKSSITSPTTSYNSSDWDSFAQNTVSGLGSHTMDCSGGGTPTVGFDLASSSQTEGNSGTTTVNIAVTMDIAPAANVTVTVTNAGTGTAAAGTDYTFSTQALTFTPGASYPNTQNVSVGVIGDTDFEANETVDLTFSISGTANAGTPDHTLSIVNDDVISGSTDLNPGDLVIIGFDNNLSGGVDKIILTNLVNLVSGTQFIIANAAYELFAAANDRTDRWYSSDTSPDNSINSYQVTYTGPGIAKGSIICLELPVLAGPNNFEVNGVSSPNFSSVNNGGPGSNGNVNFSTSHADAIFLMQGTWDFSQSAYATFSGDILGGIQDGDDWYEVNESTQGASDGYRSRKHPDIECLGIQGRTSTGSYYSYYSGPTSSNTQRNHLNNIIDYASNWTDGNGGSSNDIPDSVCTSAFTVTSAITAGQWVGNASGDANNWFNCFNWDNFQVPNINTNVIIPLTTPSCEVEYNAAFADRFDEIARCNNLTINGKVELDQNNLDYLIVNGTLSIEAGGELDMDGSFGSVGGTLELKGNWDNNNGSDGFTEGNASQVILNGSTTQTIDDIDGKENFARLTVSNLSGITLLRPVAVEQTLNMTLGNINTTSINLLEIGENISTPGTLTYLNGFVKGPMKRWFQSTINSGNASGLFPLGNPTSNENRFLLVEYTSAPSSGGSLTAQFVENVMGYEGIPIPISQTGGFIYNIETTCDDGYWNVDAADGLTGGQYSIAATGESFGCLAPFTTANVTLIKRAMPGSNWFADGTHQPTTGSIAFTTTRRTAASGWSNWGFAAGTNSLPVEWLTVDVVPLGDDLSVQWTTASEENTDYFVIEHSLDGQTFRPIDQVPAAGFSTNIQQYDWLHKNPGCGVHYYRIRQVDLDDRFEYSWVVSASIECTRLTLQIQPTLIQETCQLWFSEPLGQPVRLQLIDVLGRVLRQQTIQPSTQALDLDLSDLPAGAYFLQLDHPELGEVIQVVKQ